MPAVNSGRSLLLAVDESEASKKTFDWCLDNFYRPGDRICLLHIIPPSQHLLLTPDIGMEGLIEDDEATRRAVEEHAEQYMRTTFEARLDAAEIPYQVDIIRASVDNESIGAQICKRAEGMGAVVVLAKHTRGAVKEFFVGSVTNYTVHHCRQPVVVLHCD